MALSASRWSPSRCERGEGGRSTAPIYWDGAAIPAPGRGHCLRSWALPCGWTTVAQLSPLKELGIPGRAPGQVTRAAALGTQITWLTWPSPHHTPQTKMMDASTMTPDEVAWVDAYHQQVWKGGVRVDALHQCQVCKIVSLACKRTAIPVPHIPDFCPLFPLQVWKEVSPRLQDKHRALEWLATNTRPLAVQQREN